MMIRTQTFAALVLVLTGSAALAQPVDGDRSSGPPAPLSGQAAQGDYDSGPVSDPDGPPDAPSRAQEQRSRDLFCRRDAQARTGYMTPGEAASNEQARGTIGGTLGGAALGALIGGASGNAGAGAAIGAGAGLLAGTAVGADNARAAASDVRARYAQAYYACMNEAQAGGPPPASAGYAYGPPPPAYGYAPYPYYYYPAYPYYYDYYGPAYYGYGPSVTFGFGFGGGYHGWHGHRGGHRR